jgi:phosphoglycerol transferase
MNLFFLLTFPLVAVAAYLVLRQLPASPGAAVVVAVLYALLPYHFLRGELHVFLSAYYAVPLGAYLVIAVARGEPLVGDRRRSLITLALCVVIAAASGSFYYSAFTVVLVAAVAVLRAVANRERGALVQGGAVVGLILALSLLQLAPTIVYRAANGGNDEVAKRYWFEAEEYSLRLTQLVLPIEYHRIDALAAQRQEYADAVPQSEGRMSSLGIVGTVGFFWLLAVALVAAVGAARRYAFGVHVWLAAATLVAFLFATTGGLSTLVGVVWPQIRAWNRISVFIAFFSLAAVALLLDALRRRGLPRVAYGAVLAAVLVLGTLDQTTSAFVPPYDRLEQEYRADAEVVRALEARLPADARIVQLGYEPFPEPPVAEGKTPYEPAKPYLHSRDLRWSWGAMRGRDEDWAATIAGKPAAEVVAAARAEGFAGILVDRMAYAAPPGGAESDFQALLGPPLVLRGDQRYAFYAL